MSEAGRGDQDLMVRAAWLYYVHGKGQEEVARDLKISRFKVTRMLAQAREAGIVKISIQHETSETLALADWLAARYGLAECILTPPFDEQTGSLDDETADRLARRGVGLAGANYLTRRLLGTPRLTIGVGCGRTMTAVVDAFTAFPKQNVRFVSVIGSLTRDVSLNNFEVVRLAEACSGEGFFLPAPLVVDEAGDVDAVLRQRPVQASLALAREADFHLMSFGDCSPEAFLFRHGLLSPGDLAELRAAGAVCELAGKFFDREGRLVECGVNARTIGIALEDLRRTEVVMLAAGRSKADALQAVLKTGVVNRLIIDGELAGRLVAAMPLRERR
ncbi:DNA-binding transcriptional regulator LsrR, DeoR family [Chelatococcus sambhunathii]|uniref:DNA-binding transcriptional regulator LsrR, DeoR family n=1 Tax=Chelatococcus sambhunathii TaxID=363953 RepID=A0ABP2A6P7_9HYPH|nr:MULTISPECIES: sugar-binding transcriptional regulator [Chelatococcus]CUA89647.1 DNA-binding transcriptional regulator LsrR, DeoR family [Chelatococcus sambhunathii]